MKKNTLLDYDIESLTEARRKLERHAFCAKKENQDALFSLSDRLCEIIKELTIISEKEEKLPPA